MRRFLALAILFLAPLLAQAGDWTHWRGPLQSGVSPEKDLPTKFDVVWRAPYPGRSTPLVMKGRVYLINNVGKGVTEQERVICLDADTGKLLWEHKFNVWHTDIVSARLGWTNLAADPATESIYAHGTQGLLLCFDKNGKIRWQRSLSEEFGRISGYGGRIVSPIIVDDLVVVGMLNSSWGDQKGGARWLALNKNNGQVVWWSEPGGQPKDTFYCTPVVAVINGQKILITGGADGGVYAMKAGTGEKVWAYPLGTAMINSSPVIQGNLVYIGHGEENPDNNVLGRVVCLDASQIEKGQPKLVWKKDGVKARYSSPFVHENIVVFPDDIGRLHAFDALTGKKAFLFQYGRNARGSPVYADGKIYVGEVDAKFHILKLDGKKCERLHEEEFFSKDGKSDIEVNGSPAIANGRVYFSTSEETYCIGAKTAIPGAPGKEKAVEPTKGTKVTWLQVVPAEVTIYKGETVKFAVRAFDDHGNLLEGKTPDNLEWTLPTPPLPPGAKNPPPPLKGELKDGAFTADAKLPSQQGYVDVIAGDLKARARVRVAPQLPYSQDFEKIPNGAIPGGWVNTQGKFLIKTLTSGEKVLAKVTDKASPLVARGNAFIGRPHDQDYLIEADVQGGKVGKDMPDMGIVNNRYTLQLAGNIQKLRITSWDALPRVDRTIPFPWEPGVWYRLKLTVDLSGKDAVVKGKCWKRGEDEPKEWTLSVTDPLPNTEGAPGLYAYVTGIPEGGSGTDVFFDNVRILPNKK
jgi:outer membrane protein assembly factor BamB